MEYKGVNYGDPDRTDDRRFKKMRITPRKTHCAAKVWELYDEISRRVLLGQKGVRIAEELGCSAQTVSNVRNSPVIQDRLAVMRGARDAYTIDIARDIQEFAPTALQLLKDIISGKGAGTAASIALRGQKASEWLDRAGHKATERHVHAHLTKEEIEDIKSRALSANGPVVDAEYVVSNG